ncbi:MAG: sensor domain-containing diguanylate cyclase [Butyrivibrio sp.]|nr:sensor domain-containing diguanylate cyclase [Butyrivibrio sp.]
MLSYLKSHIKLNYLLLFILSTGFAIVLLLAGTIFGRSGLSEASFSEDWCTDNGTLIDLNDLNVGDYGGHVVLSKQLPDEIKYNESLCFIGNNLRFSVYMGSTCIYRYEPRENFTGKGYGVTYQTINLSPEYAGRSIILDVTTVFSNKGGQIRTVTLETSQDFKARLVRSQLLPFNVSVGIMILGIVLLFLRLILPYRKGRPDIVSLGIMSILVGIWLASDTGFLRLTADVIYLSRFVDHYFMHLWTLPYTLFTFSITKKREPRYPVIAFFIFFADNIFLLVARFGLNIEMSRLVYLIVISYSATLILICKMLWEDKKYCCKNNIYRDLRFFYWGIFFVAFSNLIDVCIYLSGVRSVTGRGHFSRIGFSAFFATMAVETIRTWLKDQTTLRREHFINEMLQYSVSANDPDTIIHSVLEYLGKELHADHVYIYERRDENIFHNTYEWFRQGAPKPGLEDYHDLPYVGFIDKMYDVFRRDHRMIVDYSDDTFRQHPGLYSFMREAGASRMVVGPLEYNGELVGLFGINDAPAEDCDEVSGIIWLISYFITQFIIQRDEKRDLVRYSYRDSLTGSKNRRALKEFNENTPPVAPVGYIMCDINGLKNVNDTQGHDAGDELIIDVAECLTTVFGDENVYRLGGDEFVVYSFAPTKEEFDRQTAHVRQLIARENRSASIGAVYIPRGKVDIKKMNETADRLMYKDKETFYQSLNSETDEEDKEE